MKIELHDIFIPGTVFNLSKKVLSDAEIKFWKKVSDYAPAQNKINEPELRRGFEIFCGLMRLKWFFRNDPTPSVTENPAFKTKSSGSTPKGHPCLEIYLGQVENKFLELAGSQLGYFNFAKEDWIAITSAADGDYIIIKKTDI